MEGLFNKIYINVGSYDYNECVLKSVTSSLHFQEGPAVVPRPKADSLIADDPLGTRSSCLRVVFLERDLMILIYAYMYISDDIDIYGKCNNSSDMKLIQLSTH